MNRCPECNEGQVIREEEVGVIDDLQPPANGAWWGDKMCSRANAVFAKACCKSPLVASPDLIILHKLKDIEDILREAGQVFLQNYEIE